MHARTWTALALAVTVGCAGHVDVAPVFQEFDRYASDLEALGPTGDASRELDAGRQKRAQAEALVADGKDERARRVAERAVIDARVALAAQSLGVASARADACRLETERAHERWRDAAYQLEQTEGFIGKKATLTADPPEMRPRPPELPAPMPADEAPVPPTEAPAERFDEWHRTARELGVPTADLEHAFHEAEAALRAKDVSVEEAEHQIYVAAGVVRTLERRVRTEVAERVCPDEARRAGLLADARADALRATVELERGLRGDLRRELDRLREEATSRQDELYDALSQMEGEFARIRRDARGTIVSLADILFDFDEATLRRNVEFNLVKIATILNQFGEMNIVVEGHTDSIGTDAYNLDLLKRRAKAVYDFLVSQGVVESRLSWDGFGEARPVAGNETEEGRQSNRRVDLVIQDGS